MPGSLSDYAENKLIDHILGTATYAKPTVYISLYTVAPTDSTSGTEVTGGSYARQIATFSSASSGATSNTGNIDFTNMPACTVVAVGVMDALTSGNLLAYSTLDESKNVALTDTFRIPTGDLDISIL